MGLCVTLKGLAKACGNIVGGIAKIWLFDPAYFDFTQAAPVDGVAQPYTTVEVVTGSPAPAALLFPVEFENDDAKYGVKQARKGRSSRYDHQFEFASAKLGQAITNFQQMLDGAGTDGLGMIVKTAAGQILVAGEKIVNGVETEDKQLKLAQDGSEGDTGKVMDDANQTNVVIKGSSLRGLYQYTGTTASLIALETQAA